MPCTAATVAILVIRQASPNGLVFIIHMKNNWCRLQDVVESKSLKKLWGRVVTDISDVVKLLKKHGGGRIAGLERKQRERASA